MTQKYQHWVRGTYCIELMYLFFHSREHPPCLSSLVHYTETAPCLTTAQGLCPTWGASESCQWLGVTHKKKLRINRNASTNWPPPPPTISTISEHSQNTGAFPDYSQSFLPHGQVKVPAEACEEVASDLEHLLNSILVTAGKKGLIWTLHLMP